MISTTYWCNRETPDLDRPLYSVSIASEILSSDPDTLMMYEGLGLAVPKRFSSPSAAGTHRATSWG
jgi:hypothetical protein